MCSTQHYSECHPAFLTCKKEQADNISNFLKKIIEKKITSLLMKMHQKAPKSFQTPLHMMSKFGELNLLQHLIQLSESNHLRQFMDQSLFQGDFRSVYF